MSCLARGHPYSSVSKGKRRDLAARGWSTRTATTHVELRFVWPVLAPDRHELFAARELRVKQRLERVIKYMRHFARRGAQVVQDRHVVEERDYGRDDYLVLRHEQVERADRVDMWGVQWECDLLIRLPELMREGAMLEQTDTQERTADSPPFRLHRHPPCLPCLLAKPSAQDASAVLLTAWSIGRGSCPHAHTTRRAQRRASKTGVGF
jgi:hypothetical protein